MKWKQLEDCPSYRVSDTGLVQRITTGQGARIGKLIKPFVDKQGYLHVTLCENGKVLGRLVHRLVALAFIPNPKQLPEVNHKRRPKLNCRVSNLEWRSRQGNKDHAVHHGYTRGDVVHFNSATAKWTARYSPKGKRNTYLGEYSTKAEALRVRNVAVEANIPI
jgi:hypothetical protein